MAPAGAAGGGSPPAAGALRQAASAPRGAAGRGGGVRCPGSRPRLRDFRANATRKRPPRRFSRRLPLPIRSAPAPHPGPVRGGLPAGALPAAGPARGGGAGAAPEGRGPAAVSQPLPRRAAPRGGCGGGAWRRRRRPLAALGAAASGSGPCAQSQPRKPPARKG